MVRVRETLKKGLPVVAGALAGAVVAIVLAGGTARATAGGIQDPAVQMQIQQALNNFQIQLQTQMNLVQQKIDSLEREQQNMRVQINNADRARSGVPIPADPIPGTTTYGRLVSEVTDSRRFELSSARGDLLAQLGMTSDGPGLILFDVTGQISVALLATPLGPELRMTDADGTLQTVLSGQ